MRTNSPAVHKCRRLLHPDQHLAVLFLDVIHLGATRQASPSANICLKYFFRNHPPISPLFSLAFNLLPITNVEEAVNIGGGGGGGALLIAASNGITVNGAITANGGGNESYYYGSGFYYSGSGSGGAIRLVASKIIGSGTIGVYGQNGNNGRIRFDTFENDFSGNVLLATFRSRLSADHYSNFRTSGTQLAVTSVGGSSRFRRRPPVFCPRRMPLFPPSKIIPFPSW